MCPTDCCVVTFRGDRDRRDLREEGEWRRRLRGEGDRDRGERDRRRFAGDLSRRCDRWLDSARDLSMQKVLAIVVNLVELPLLKLGALENEGIAMFG